MSINGDAYGNFVDLEIYRLSFLRLFIGIHVSMLNSVGAQPNSF